ncbi:hypothetical protein MUA03_22320 [Enterobacteriaceae bacterium H16N7]|nr:hypothetical protein [Dryocola clanedunensis]
MAKKQAYSLFFLPNGPYGRPFDNQYYVDEVKELVGGFSIHFTDGLVLRFNGDVTTLETEDKLIIENFRTCTFEIGGKIKFEFDYGHVSLC